MRLVVAFHRPNFDAAWVWKCREKPVTFLKNNLFTRLVQSNFVGKLEGFFTPEGDILTMEKRNLLFTHSFFEAVKS